MRFGTWNLGSVIGKEEVCEELRERMIDVCCSQEVRWRRQCARMLGMKEEDKSCSGLVKYMELVVWELW